MDKNEISVVIPTYNRSKLVCDAIDSVLEQTYFDYIKEIIIIDDGSTDDTENVIKKRYKDCKEVKYYKKKNGGVSSARNLGMKYASGQWIALLDSDDEWLQQKIEYQVKAINTDPDIDFIGTNYNDIDLKIGFKKITTLYKATVKDLCIKFFPVTPSMLFKRKIIDEIGGFDENQKYAEDGDFGLRVCIHYNYYHLPVSLVRIGHGKRSFGDSGLSGNMKEMYLGNIKNIKKLKKYNVISSWFYFFLYVFYFMKYCRRKIIVALKI